MHFTAGPDAYDRFMGRYSTLLAPEFAGFVGITAGRRVLDVGSGPGALTAELVERVGPDAVAAVDPSESFIAAARDRYPGVNVNLAAAERLPFRDDSFDMAMAQLVVHFMTRPVDGLREMARVTRSGGVVAACVWDLAGDRGPLNLFWQAARELDHKVEDESHLAGVREGHLAELLNSAGLREIVTGALTVGVEHPTFEDWWEPFTLGVGPAGRYAAGLDGDCQARLRELCREMLPAPPFVIRARAWAARGLV